MTRPEVLEAAIQCVTKDRNRTHGNPENNFATIANYWNAYLANQLTAQLAPTDIAAMMILLKVSRLANSPEHPDHWIDIAGYAACGGEIATDNERES